MYEHRKQRLLSWREFLLRLAGHGVFALLLVSGSLGLGVLGFHLLSRQSWLDAFMNSAMLLGGMGPIGDMGKTSGKIFAAFYALYAGLVFIAVSGLLFTPVFHRVMHRLHIDESAVERRV
jgi:hypothetical protein